MSQTAVYEVANGRLQRRERRLRRRKSYMEEATWKKLHGSSYSCTWKKRPKNIGKTSKNAYFVRKTTMRPRFCQTNDKKCFDKKMILMLKKPLLPADAIVVPEAFTAKATAATVHSQTYGCVFCVFRQNPYPCQVFSTILPKKSNFSFCSTTTSNENFRNDRQCRCNQNKPKIIKIGAIVTIFRPFEISEL